MSIKLMAVVWELDLPPGEKLVLLALADQANDDGRNCWPSVATIRKRSGQSDRTVQRAILSLVKQGHLTQHQRAGTSAQYHVHPRQVVTPDTMSPRHDDAPTKATPTPDMVSPKPLRTTIPQKASPSSEKRDRASAVRVSADFVPTPSSGSITAKVMDAWPPGERDEQVEHFIDHHSTHGTLSLDWQASWRTWVKNWKRFNGQRSHHHRHDTIRDPLVAACANAVARDAGDAHDPLG